MTDKPIPYHRMASWYGTPYAETREIRHENGVILRLEGDKVHVIPKGRKTGTRFYWKGPHAKIHWHMLCHHAALRLGKTKAEATDMLIRLIGEKPDCDTGLFRRTR